MSADNGIYIASFPRPARYCHWCGREYGKGDKAKDCNGCNATRHVSLEYRVNHTQNIEDCDLGSIDKQDAARISIFGKPRRWNNLEEATHEAKEMYDEIIASDCPVLEYGIVYIEFDRALLPENRMCLDRWSIK